MGKFDWNKLDSCKAAIDDGLIVGRAPEDGIHSESREWFVLWSKDGFYFMEDGTSNKTYSVKEKDWETFKQKVADYFLGGDK